MHNILINRSHQTYYRSDRKSGKTLYFRIDVHSHGFRSNDSKSPDVDQLNISVKIYYLLFLDTDEDAPIKLQQPHFHEWLGYCHSTGDFRIKDGVDVAYKLQSLGVGTVALHTLLREAQFYVPERPVSATRDETNPECDNSIRRDKMYKHAGMTANGRTFRLNRLKDATLLETFENIKEEEPFFWLFETLQKHQTARTAAEREIVTLQGKITRYAKWNEQLFIKNKKIQNNRNDILLFVLIATFFFFLR